MHTLKKIVQNKTEIQKLLQGIDSLTKIEIKIPQAQFAAEARDFAQHNLMDFYKSPVFMSEFRVEDNNIVSLKKW